MSKEYVDVYSYLEELVKVTKSVRNIYHKLLCLELAGCKDSPEYKKNLEYLKIAIEVEDELYAKCPDCRKCFEEIDSVMKGTVSKKGMKKIFVVFFESEDELIKKRIQDTFFNKITFGKYFADIIKRNFDDMMVGDSIVEMLQETISIYDSIASDLKKFSLQFIEKAFQKKDNKVVKKELLSALYNIIFADKRVEANIMANGFIIPEEKIFDSDLAIQLSKINISSFDEMKDKYATSILVNVIGDMLEITDNDFYNEKMLARGIVLQSIMRASILLMDPNSISDVQRSLEDYIKSTDYNSDYKKRHVSENLIHHVFETSQNDKQKTIHING